MSFRSSKSFILLILSLAQFFGLSMWFSTNAVINQLTDLWNLTQFDLSFLSILVILGFVTGALLFSIFNLPDVIDAKKFFLISCILGAMANLMSALAQDLYFMQISRYLTGFFLAGIYPVGMKLTASHFKKNRGFALGILLSALTIGTGMPYLFNLIGVPDWRLLISFSSILSIIGGFLVFLFVEEGPFVSKAKFSIHNLSKVLTNRAVLLANFGYYGHMIELYAFWVWIPVFLTYSYTIANPGSDSTFFFSMGTFLIFLGGAVANAIGGYFADLYGKTNFTILMLLISGSSAVIIGLFIEYPLIVLVIAIIWGITVIPDSPQYSALVSSLVDDNLIGTALTIQTSIGFLLTIFSINLIPILQESIGWELAFVPIVLGPIFGIFSLIVLHNHPDYKKMREEELQMIKLV